MNAKSLGLVKSFATQYDLDYRIVYAICMTESQGHGVMHGKIIKRYEPHIYNGFVKVKNGQRKKHPSLPGLETNWIRKHTLTELKLLSTSLGIGQIMGWHYPSLGYESIGAMLKAWMDEEVQLKDMFRFILVYRNGDFFKALQRIDYIEIAKMWNGPGYKKNNYDVKLKKEYDSMPQIVFKEPEPLPPEPFKPKMTFFESFKEMVSNVWDNFWYDT